MQRALCNATAEGEDDHTHICNLDHAHKGQAHYCRCGTFFLIVKDSDLPASGTDLEKVQ